MCQYIGKNLNQQDINFWQKFVHPEDFRPPLFYGNTHYLHNKILKKSVELSMRKKDIDLFDFRTTSA